jgi:hypothetical protein
MDDADATYWTGLLLVGALEMARDHDEAGSEWYREDLLAKLHPAERVAIGADWIRRAAYLGSPEATKYMMNIYKWGWHRQPADRELSECFAAAHVDHTKLETCRQMEVAKGYVTKH